MWIVFLEINPGFSAAFAAASELGLKILYLSRDQSVLSRLPVGSVNERVHTEDLLESSLIDAIHRAVINEKVVGIWTLRDQLIPLCTTLNAEFFQNKGAIQQVALSGITKNKLLLRRALDGTSFNPKFAVVDTSKDLNHPLPGRPVVVKPLLGYSSIGVEFVRDDKDFSRALQRALATTKQLSENVPSTGSFDSTHLDAQILVEEFISGREFSVEVFATGGIYHVVGICSKSDMRPPFFEEISYLMPAEIEPNLKLQLTEAAREIAALLGLYSGMAHIEFRLSDCGPKVLDIGLRLGGGGLTHGLVAASSGVNLIKAVIAEFSGLDSTEYLRPTKDDLAVLFLLQVEAGGTVQSLPDFQTHFSQVKLVQSEFFLRVGDKTVGYPEYSGLPGYALFSVRGSGADSYQVANKLVECNLNQARLIYEEAK